MVDKGLGGEIEGEKGRGRGEGEGGAEWRRRVVWLVTCSGGVGGDSAGGECVVTTIEAWRYLLPATGNLLVAVRRERAVITTILGRLLLTF